MHQYRIEIYAISETGVVGTIPMATRYADTHEDARMICEEFATQKYEETGWAKYKVNLAVLCYKNVNKTEFFAQF